MVGQLAAVLTSDWSADVSLSPTPSEIARLPSGSDTGKESSLDDLLDALQNYPNSEAGSNTDSAASEPPDPGTPESRLAAAQDYF